MVVVEVVVVVAHPSGWGTAYLFRLPQSGQEEDNHRCRENPQRLATQGESSLDGPPSIREGRLKCLLHWLWEHLLQPDDALENGLGCRLRGMKDQRPNT